MNKLLTFLNLLDAQGNLSITNVAVLVTLIKLAISPSASITEAGTLLVALANYAHKRKTTSDVNKTQLDVEAKIQDAMTSATNQINELQGKVNGLVLRIK